MWWSIFIVLLGYFGITQETLCLWRCFRGIRLRREDPPCMREWGFSLNTKVKIKCQLWTSIHSLLSTDSVISCPMFSSLRCPTSVISLLKLWANISKLLIRYVVTNVRKVTNTIADSVDSKFSLQVLCPSYHFLISGVSVRIIATRKCLIQRDECPPAEGYQQMSSTVLTVTFFFYIVLMPATWMEIVEQDHSLPVSSENS